MNIHVLPGIDPKTENWANMLVEELAKEQDKTTVQRYLHWNGSDMPVQREAEIERLMGVNVDLLLCKSLGVGLGLRACARQIISPSRVVLIGTPLTSLVKQGHDLKRMVSEARVQSLFIQQEDDPLGTAANLRETIPEETVIGVSGNDHQYMNIGQLVRHIHKWLT